MRLGVFLKTLADGNKRLVSCIVFAFMKESLVVSLRVNINLDSAGVCEGTLIVLNSSGSERKYSLRK